MKIIYEVGDTVEVEDNMEVPYDLAASYVQQDKQIGHKQWEVTVVEGWGVPTGTKAVLDEKWML